MDKKTFILNNFHYKFEFQFLNLKFCIVKDFTIKQLIQW